MLSARITVSNLRQYLSKPKPDSLLCSGQCEHLVGAMKELADWLHRWERGALPAPFAEDLLTVATKGVRLIEDVVHATSSSSLGIVACRMERREEFKEVYEGILQALESYVEVMQGSVSPGSTRVNGRSSLGSISSVCLNKSCLEEARGLIRKLREKSDAPGLLAPTDRENIFKHLHRGIFAEGEEAKKLLMEYEKKQPQPFLLNSSGVMYSTSEPLGGGSSGDVYKGTWMNMEVAVKEFRNHEKLDAELKTLRKAGHANVMRAIAYSQESSGWRSALVMERMEGDLNKFVEEITRKRADLPSSVTIEILRQIAEGMDHLHSEKIMHRDLNPNNILFSRWPPMSTQELRKGPGDFTVKITDFEICRTPGYDTTLATDKRGTARYRAPEVLRGVGDDKARYSNKVDVYSFGVVCYKLLNRKEPDVSWDSSEKKYSELEIPSSVPWVWQFFMRKCLAEDHRTRPDFAAICDFLALFKSIVLNTRPTDGHITTPLFMGMGGDVLQRLTSFLGDGWLLREAESLGMSLEVESLQSPNGVQIEEFLQCLQSVPSPPDRKPLGWMCCFGE